MSERVFAVALLLLSGAGVLFGWNLRAPVAYEPVGPAAFPVLVFVLLGVCALALLLQQQKASVWPPAPVLWRVGGLFAAVLIYAWLFDKAGFVLATVLLTVPLARLFGASWRQGIAGGIGLGVGLYLLFDRILDVALPLGQWLKPVLG